MTEQEPSWVKYQQQKEEEIIEKIRGVGALLEGHFVYTSGLHGNAYVNKDLISTRPSLVDWLARKTYVDARAEIVVCAATGAIPYASRLADLKDINCFAYAEPVDEKPTPGKPRRYEFRRGFADVVRGKRVLVAEDIITTGGTVEEVIKAVENLGGEVVGVVCIWMRSLHTFTVPFETLVTKMFPTWHEKECPLCRKGTHINTEVGHGRKFLEKWGENPANWPANRGDHL